MPDVRPVMLLVKVPVPVPLVVLKLPVVGPVVVAQQMPLAVTGVPPSAVIFPPDTALVDVVKDIIAVVSVANAPELDVNEISFP